MIRHLGRYQILGELGRGGMGVVYKALDPHLERLVAIKCLNEELARDELVVARFLREARNVAALSHPNCVRIYVVDEQDGMPYFVMEYVDGSSLADYLARHRRCAPDMARRITRECAEALAAADAKNIIHRDVKPGNVMLDSTGRALLADFGIACIQHGPATASSTIMGTPGYMAPELIEKGIADRRSDIFALGAVYYEMLTGKRLIPGDAIGEVRAVMQQPGFPDLSEIEQAFGAETAEVLGRMLAADPEQRFDDYGALLEPLDPAHAESTRRKAETAPTVQVTTMETDSGAEAVTPTAAATEQAADCAVAETQVLTPPGLSRYRTAGLSLVAIAGLAAIIGLAIAFTGGDRSGRDNEPQAMTSLEPARNEGTATTTTADPIPSGPVTAADQPFTPARDVPGQSSSAAGFRIETASGTTGPQHPGTDGSEVPAEVLVAEATPAGTIGIDSDPARDASYPTPSTAASAADTPPHQPMTTDDRALGIVDEADVPIADAADAEDLSLAAVAPRVGEPRVAVAERSLSQAAGSLRESARPRPAAVSANKIIVVPVGDPALVRPIAAELEQALRQLKRPVTDSRFVPDFDRYRHEDGVDLAGLTPAALDSGVRYLVLLRAVPAGERQLNYYGRTDTAWIAQVDAVTYDLLRSEQIGQATPVTIEYTDLNARSKAAEVARAWIDPIIAQFR
ncbi:MAG: hypothetical protein Kow0020_14610 [Wenzhouxiangellaceae bacterium]